MIYQRGNEIGDNERARACNLCDPYWLYVVFECTRPRWLRVRDPFGWLLARSRESVAYTISAEAIMEAAE